MLVSHNLTGNNMIISSILQIHLCCANRAPILADNSSYDIANARSSLALCPLCIVTTHYFRPVIHVRIRLVPPIIRTRLTAPPPRLHVRVPLLHTAVIVQQLTEATPELGVYKLASVFPPEVGAIQSVVCVQFVQVGR